jgi:hypothetical protein
MVGSDEDRGRCMRLGAEDCGWLCTGRVLGGQTIERSGDAVCGLLRAQGDKECGSLGLASKLGLTVSPGLASKSVVTVLVISQFGPQNWQLWFDDLAHKITTTVSWFGPQNQVGYGLPVVPQNRREDKDGVGHASRSSSLLRLEASQTRVSKCSFKTGGGVTWMMHVASSRRSCGDEAEDGRVDATGCIGLLYPNFVVFIVLGHKGNLVISFPINKTPRAGGEVNTQSSLSYPLATVTF